MTEDWHTRLLTWVERHEFRLARWTSESAKTTPAAKPRMSLRRPDRRT